MTASQRKALSAHRQRLKRAGIVRLEMKVHKEDAELLRNVANALADPEYRTKARAILNECFGTSEKKSLKLLIAAAPLQDVNLDREHDTGRRITL